MSGPGLPRLHVVTDDGVLARPGWRVDALEVLRRCGPDVALHLRGPRTSGRVLHELASELEGPASASGAMLVVNDRVDVALSVDRSVGVQLGGRSLPLAIARDVVGRERAIGVSCRDAAEVEAAAAGGADWILVGNVWETPTHPGRTGLGTESVTDLVARAAGRCPVIGIGGIDVARVGALLAAGASGVAVVRGVWSATDPAAAASEYISALAAR